MWSRSVERGGGVGRAGKRCGSGSMLLPAAHGVHDVAPVVVEYVPAGHGVVAVVAPTGQYAPAVDVHGPLLTVTIRKTHAPQHSQTADGGIRKPCSVIMAAPWQQDRPSTQGRTCTLATSAESSNRTRRSDTACTPSRPPGCIDPQRTLPSTTTLRARGHCRTDPLDRRCSS